MQFSFIHAADLHLDATFKGVSSKASHLDHHLKKASTRAFENLVTLALEKKVDFVLIAGDIFDWREQSIQAQMLFAKAMRRLKEADITVFIVWGNHDPFDKLELAVELPENVVTFPCDKPETHLVKKDGDILCHVTGISHKGPKERRNLASKIAVQLPASGFHIALLHANAGDTGHDNYAPCTLSDLKKAKVDYWALGHVHHKKILSESPYIVYPGNIQGLNPNEAGEKGCFLVTADSETEELISMEFYPLDYIRWHNLEYDLSEIDQLDKMEEGIKKMLVALDAQPQGTKFTPSAHLCRILLKGRSPLFWPLQKEMALEDLVEVLNDWLLESGVQVWIEKIKRKIRPPLDLEARRKRDDLLGEVLKMTGLLHKNERERKEAIEKCFAPMKSNRKLRKLLDDLPSGFDLELIDEVEGLLINMLEGD